MAKIIAIFDVGSNGSKVRLDDGRTIEIAGHPSVGDEIFGAGPGGKPPVIPMTIEQMNGGERVTANLPSEVVTRGGEAASRVAHNHEIEGVSPSRATKPDPTEGIT